MSWRNATKTATAARVKQARAAPVTTRPLGLKFTLPAKTGACTTPTTNTGLRGKAPHLFVPRGIRNARVNIADFPRRPPAPVEPQATAARSNPQFSTPHPPFTPPPPAPFTPSKSPPPNQTPPPRLKSTSQINILVRKKTSKQESHASTLKLPPS